MQRALLIEPLGAVLIYVVLCAVLLFVQRSLNYLPRTHRSTYPATPRR